MKYVYEALQRLKLEAFQEWLQQEDKNDVIAEFTKSEAFPYLFEERKASNMEAAMDSVENLAMLFTEYEEKIRNREFGPMAEFWQSFLDMVQILLDFIRAVRTGDWDLHLQTCQRMLVWTHAYDRVNYSRYFT